MRRPVRRAGPARPWAFIALVAIACLAAACAEASPLPKPVPTVQPTPYVFPTPWPHMIAPATADDVYLALLADNLSITPNTATAGKDPVKVIDATFANWPLAILQYRTVESLQAASRWKPGVRPGKGEAPIEFIGLNILVKWGPIAAGTPIAELDDRQVAAAVTLRDKLDRLLSPLASRTVVDLPAAGASASPGTGGSPGPSTAPSATP